MKKRLVCGILTAAMAISLCACGGSDSDTSSSASDNSASSDEVQDVTLTVMGPSEDQDEANGAWLQAQCDAFNEAHPEWNITFDYKAVSESDAKDEVLKDVKAAADVYMFANDQIADLVDGNGIAELGGDTADYVTTSNSDTVAASVTYNGSIYGIPYTHNTWFMYYDKRVYTDESMVSSMESLLENGKVSFPLCNGWYLSAFYTANGCTFYGDGTDQDGTIDFSSDKATPVTEYICNLVNNENFVADSSDGSIGLAGLADGSVNVFFNGNWNYDAVCEALGGAENVGIAALPTININGTDCQMKAFYGSKAIGVNPNCENMEVAVALAAYLGSEDAQLAHYETRSQIPVNQDALATLTDDPIAQAFAGMADHASIVQPIFGMSGYWTAAENFGYSFTGGNADAEDQSTQYSTTLDNAAEQTEAFNTAINESLVE